MFETDITKKARPLHLNALLSYGRNPYLLSSVAMLAAVPVLFFLPVHRERGNQSPVSVLPPAYLDPSPRFRGIACKNCAEKVGGYHWAQLNDVRKESPCRRFAGGFLEGCLAEVQDRMARPGQ